MRIPFTLLLIAVAAHGNSGTPAVSLRAGAPDTSHNEGAAAIKRGEFRVAEQHFRAALQAFPPDAVDPRMLNLLNGLVQSLRAQAKVAEAETVLEKRLAVRQKVAAGNVVEIARDLRELGQVTFAQMKFVSSQKYFGREAETLQKRFGVEYPPLAASYYDAAAAAHALAKSDEAESLLRKAIGLMELTNPGGDLAREYLLLGNVHAASAKPAEAETAYKKALANIERVHGSDTLQSAAVLDAMAKSYREQRNTVKAESTLLRLLSLQTSLLGPTSPVTVPTLESLGSLYRETKQFAEAAAFFERAYEIRKNMGDAAATAWTVQQMTDVYAQMGKYTDAEPLMVQLYNQREQDLLAMLRTYAGHQKAVGHYAEANVLYGLAVQIYDRLWPARKIKKKDIPKMPRPPAFMVETLEQHAFVLRKLNKKKDASKLEDRAKPLKAILLLLGA